MANNWDGLYTDLLYRRRAGFSTERLTADGGFLELAWGSADDTFFYLCRMLGRTRAEEDICRFLCFADYITYIPYGDEGYQIFENLVKKEGSYPSAAAWRTEQIGKILQLGGEREVISHYFETYFKENLSSDILDITRVLCRLFHNCEADYAHSPDAVEKSADLAATLADDFFPRRQTFTAAEVLSAGPPQRPLGGKELAFLEEFAASALKR